MVSIIRKSWGWAGLEAAEVVTTNAFGNVIVRATDGAFWRICPEEPSCALIARTEDDLRRLWRDDDFLVDWQMEALVRAAEAALGPPGEGRCYCLRLPALLGGEYAAENIGTVPRVELIAFAGDIARQIRDVPDGGRVVIKIVEGDAPPTDGHR